MQLLGGQSGPGSNGKGVLHNPQISKDGASPSDGLMSSPERYTIQNYISEPLLAETKYTRSNIDSEIRII